jgi:hypothetical protein
METRSYLLALRSSSITRPVTARVQATRRMHRRAFLFLVTLYVGERFSKILTL